MIYGWLFSAWSWVPWVLGLGTVGWIALALLAPGLLNAVSPLLRGAAEGLVEVVKVFYSGLVDILDSWKTVATVVFLIFLVGNYWDFKTEQKQQQVAKTERHRAVPKKTRETSPAYKDPFSWVWGRHELAN